MKTLSSDEATESFLYLKVFLSSINENAFVSRGTNECFPKVLEGVKKRLKRGKMYI